MTTEPPTPARANLTPPHSPLPWKAEFWINDNGLGITDASGIHFVLQIAWRNGLPNIDGPSEPTRIRQIDRDNAAFIIEAANNHELLQSALTASEAARAELQGALQEVLDWRDSPEGPEIMFSRGTKMLDRIRALLAQPPATTEGKP